MKTFYYSDDNRFKSEDIDAVKKYEEKAKRIQEEKAQLKKEKEDRKSEINKAISDTRKLINDYCKDYGTFESSWVDDDSTINVGISRLRKNMFDIFNFWG